MQLLPEEAPAYLASRSGVFGEGWKEVDTFDGIDMEEYEDEEEEYVTLDLGPDMDPRYLQTEGSYQLIGMDTPLPHLKMGNTVLQGEVTPLIGSEIILGLIRNQENPLRPSHPPVHTTSHRTSFRQITLLPKDQPEVPNKSHSRAPTFGSEGQGLVEGEGGMDLDRPMFLMAPAKYGPNKPPVLPGRKRDRERAARRADRAEEDGGGGEGEEEMDLDEEHEDQMTTPPADESTSAMQDDTDSPMTPVPGPAEGTGSGTPDWSSWRPRTHGRGTGGPIGRPRTRPLIEVGSLAELANVDVEHLAHNVRVMILPSVLHELDHIAPFPQTTSGPSTPTPTTPTPTALGHVSKDLDAMHLPTRPLEYTRTQFRKLYNQVHAQTGTGSESGSGSRPRARTRTITGDEEKEGDEESEAEKTKSTAVGSVKKSRKPISRPRNTDTEAMFVTVNTEGRGPSTPGDEDDDRE